MAEMLGSKLLQKVGNGHKVIEGLGSASLIDLKVELAKKQAEYKLKLLNPDTTASVAPSRSLLFSIPAGRVQ